MVVGHHGIAILVSSATWGQPPEFFGLFVACYVATNRVVAGHRFALAFRSGRIAVPLFGHVRPASTHLAARPDYGLQRGGHISLVGSLIGHQARLMALGPGYQPCLRTRTFITALLRRGAGGLTSATAILVRTSHPHPARAA